MDKLLHEFKEDLDVVKGTIKDVEGERTFRVTLCAKMDLFLAHSVCDYVLQTHFGNKKIKFLTSSRQGYTFEPMGGKNAPSRARALQSKKKAQVVQITCNC